MTEHEPLAPASDPLHRPQLWPLDPDVAYLNHGSLGATPHEVIAEQRRWQARIDANPMGFYRRGRDAEMDRVRATVSTFLGAGEGALALTTNVTAAIATVLASFPLREGDRILVTDHAYGSVKWNAELAAERVGAEVDTVHVPLGADDEMLAEAVLAGVTEHTRLAIVDHVGWMTAQIFPLERIIPALRARGVMVIVDAAHSPGSLPVDVAALGADFWAGNLHKWAGAPRSVAGLYAAEEHRETLHSFPLSWREPEGFPNSFSHVGTTDQTAWLAAPAGLEFYGRFGWDAVRERNNALARRAQLLVAEEIGANLEGVPGEATGSYPLPMRLVPLDGVPAHDRDACVALVNRLALEHAIEVPVEPWNGRAYLRLSAQLYNSEPDYERLARALKELL